MFGFGFMRPGGASQIVPQDAVARAKAGELTVIDVRDANEIAQTGKAEGAVHIPLATIQMKTDPRSPEFHPELSTEKPVAIYCASGARSAMASQVLNNHGFSEVYNLGGFMHWAQAGGAVTR